MTVLPALCLATYEEEEEHEGDGEQPVVGVGAHHHIREVGGRENGEGREEGEPDGSVVGALVALRRAAVLIKKHVHHHAEPEHEAGDEAQQLLHVPDDSDRRKHRLADLFGVRCEDDRAKDGRPVRRSMSGVGGRLAELADGVLG